MTSQRTFRDPERPRLVLAHVAYGLGAALVRRDAGLSHVEVRTGAKLAEEISTADVAVVSGLWRNDLLALAPHLVLVQSISVGINNFDLDLFRAAGVRLANASGLNRTAVAEHALALMLALTRHIHAARDNQARRFWRPMNGDAASRESELAGRTVVIVGLGPIGERIAALCRAFDMHVIGVRRNVGAGSPSSHQVVEFARLDAVLPSADVLVLACPLTPDTERLIDGRRLRAMKRTAHLVNVARGRVVDEADLVDALRDQRIAAAALDVTWDEPLPDASPLWSMPNVLITPHSAGETRDYEERIVDLTLENIARIRAGGPLLNGVV